jgi:predicted DNA-binding protein
MTAFTIESTPKIQFPLRLEYNLHHEFRNLSERTKIPMSTLGRLSITKFLHEIETKGITHVLNEMEGV